MSAKRLRLLLGLAWLASCAHVGAAPSRQIELELKDTPVIEALRTVAGNAQLNLFADSDLVALEPVTMHLAASSGEEALGTLAALRQLRLEKLNVSGVQNACFWVSRQSSDPAPVTTFTGERITARFDEAPIRDVARTMSEIAKTEIVVDDDVEANITLHLRLPWDLALYHLGQKYELRIIRTDKLIRIARR
jgi:type II secretory pathway component HofQ